MSNDLYIQIIKKQQELVDLMLNAGIGDNQNAQPHHAENTIESYEPTITDKVVTKFNNQNEKSEHSKTVSIQREKNNSRTGKKSKRISPESQNKLEEFVKWLDKKGRSKNCIDSYTETLKLFFRRYDEVTVDTLTDYEKYLNENFSPGTVNLRISGMVKYFEFIGFSGYDFKKAKLQKQTFCDSAINEKQFNKFIEYSKENAPKAWLIAKVIAGTGVRVSELIELKTEDIDKGYCDIVGKGNKQRRIYFPNKLVKQIKGKCGKEYIIENRYGLKISTRGVSAILKTAGEKAGIAKEVMHPHSFRHYFAKQFMKKTQDISLLGDLLGHSNIATTAIYTRLSSDEQKNEINKLVNW